MSRLKLIWMGIVFSSLVTSAASAKCTKVEKATVWGPDGVREVEQAWILDGKLLLDRPKLSCISLPMRNVQITTGLVETVSSLGLVEVGLESTTVDGNAH